MFCLRSAHYLEPLFALPFGGLEVSASASSMTCSHTTIDAPELEERLLLFSIAFLRPRAGQIVPFGHFSALGCGDATAVGMADDGVAGAHRGALPAGSLGTQPRVF